MTSLSKSTIIVTPSRGLMHLTCALAHSGIAMPVNHYVTRIGVVGREVGDAYSRVVHECLNNPKIGKFKYMLTLEDDVLPPPNGLLKLIKAMDHGYDIVAGLYRIKSDIEPYYMVYGDPNSQEGADDTGVADVRHGEIQEVNGTGMGFTLFKMDLFRDERFKRPWFQTINDVDENGDVLITTQDMFFMMQARKFGYKIAVDTTIHVDHLDWERGILYQADPSKKPAISMYEDRTVI